MLQLLPVTSGRTKLAEDRQKEINTLHDKIKDSVEELSKPFPQQEEYEQLSMRSTELTNLLNEDANSTERDKADIEQEKKNRVENILNGESESMCEEKFFVFARKKILQQKSLSTRQFFYETN